MENIMTIQGKIKRLLLGFGFIEASDKEDIFFHFSILDEKDKEQLNIGKVVDVKYSKNDKGYIASAINFQDNDIKKDSTEEYDSYEIIKNISKNWKLEAKLEDNKYFYNLSEAKQILDGEKLFIIGRKGSGKSAICEYIVNQKQHNIFSKKLSFKNFPFNDLYHLENIQSYTEPNQYITMWKYLIYSTICHLMVSNENIDSHMRNELEKLYPKNAPESLARTINTWTSAEFGANILGQGGTIKVGRDVKINYSSWIDRVNILEDIISTYCDNAEYFIVFDELDEDYRVIKEEGSHKNYTNLLTSLFKAVQDVKSNLQEKNIFPIVFLRDDIYALIKDSDKNKWRDYKLDIEWNQKKLKDLLSFRISQDTLNITETLSFQDVWKNIFTDEVFGVGNKAKKKIKSFEFISNSTQLRPRDYIHFIRVCAEETISRGRNKIQADTVKYADREFSNYLKDEIVDEIYPILPDIDIILQIITNIRKPIFSVDEFKNEYQTYIQSKTLNENNIDFVLNTLFNFSIIGNQHKRQENIFYFKYLQTNMNFNKNEAIVLHRGLLKALRII